jgi:hypothetical protein
VLVRELSNIWRDLFGEMSQKHFAGLWNHDNLGCLEQMHMMPTPDGQSALWRGENAAWQGSRRRS